MRYRGCDIVCDIVENCVISHFISSARLYAISSTISHSDIACLDPTVERLVCNGCMMAPPLPCLRPRSCLYEASGTVPSSLDCAAMPQTTCRLYLSLLHPRLDRWQRRWLLEEGAAPAAVTFENSVPARQRGLALAAFQHQWATLRLRSLALTALARTALARKNLFAGSLH